MRTQASNETLGDKRSNGRSDQKWLHSHVEKTSNATNRIIRMQRTKNQVTCESGTDSDLGGLEITHFTDHDHIRITSKNTTQRRGKGKVDLGLNGDLDHPIELMLHRIFNRYDAPLLGIDGT